MKTIVNPLQNKQVWKPGTLLNPLPCVLVSCQDKAGQINLMTAAWSGVVCSEPPTVYVSIRPERYSHHMIMETGVYVLNLTTEALVTATDYCGVRSGAKEDKWAACHLTPMAAAKVTAPLVAESPVNIECTVKQILHLGSHDLFIGQVESVDVDETYMDETGCFHLEKSGLIAYNHGEYVKLGKSLGRFGFSVRKKRSRKNR